MSEVAGALEDRVKLWRWEKRLKLVDRARNVMKARGLSAPTRELPTEFAIRLLDACDTADSEALKDLWANLLANAADASSGVMPRTTYIEILSRMTAFDAHNLEILVKATIRHQGKTRWPFLSTYTPVRQANRIILTRNLAPVCSCRP